MPSCSTPSRQQLPHCQDNGTQNFGPPPEITWLDMAPLGLMAVLALVVWVALLSKSRKVEP